MNYWHRLRLVSLLGLVAVWLLVLLFAARSDPATAPPARTNNNFNL